MFFINTYNKKCAKRIDGEKCLCYNDSYIFKNLARIKAREKNGAYNEKKLHPQGLQARA